MDKTCMHLAGQTQADLASPAENQLNCSSIRWSQSAGMALRQNTVLCTYARTGCQQRAVRNYRGVEEMTLV